MPLKLRLLLTNACSARCAYCHNEGQQKANDRLDPATITHLLDTLACGGMAVGEIALSGGEPTLHPQLPEIARRCKATGAVVSMNSHAGHPTKLAPALPWLDELKIHVDSFDPLRQRASMGIGIARVRQSIEAAQAFGDLRLVINHPMQSLTEACLVIDAARALAVDVKLIELLDTAGGQPRLQQVPWAELGYRSVAAGVWRHENATHSVLTRRCAQAEGETGVLFVGPDGIRLNLQAPILAPAEKFSLDMLSTPRHKAVCKIASRRTHAPQVIEWTRRHVKGPTLSSVQQACHTALPVPLFA